jgi:hypothetical protein
MEVSADGSSSSDAAASEPAADAAALTVAAAPAAPPGPAAALLGLARGAGPGDVCAAAATVFSYFVSATGTGALQGTSDAPARRGHSRRRCLALLAPLTHAADTLCAVLSAPTRGGAPALPASLPHHVLSAAELLCFVLRTGRLARYAAYLIPI